jgi:MHS family shikimate/dehydroshikimate transporter-like MFS transporter
MSFQPTLQRETEDTSSRPNSRLAIRRIAFASLVGTTIEYYDFFAYGTAAALIFPKLFFPSLSGFAGTLASFATFGVGLFARPVGGVVFGHFGDRVGRKSILVLTLLIMGAATFLIGLLPVFATVGVLAPALLVILRFLQGFAVGGEWGGATLIAVEHAPRECRNFYGSWPQLGVPAGLMLSTAMFVVLGLMPNQQFLAWGWRILFLASAVLVAVGLFIRMRIMETPEFQRVKDGGSESKLPILDLLRNHFRNAVLAVGIMLLFFTPFYIITTFTLSYLAERHVATSVGLIGIFLAGASEATSILLFASLADRIGKSVIAIWSSGALILLSFPYFWLIDTGRPVAIWSAISSYIFIGAAYYSVGGIILCELFETRVRYSGISFGYQVGALIGGAPAPFICTALVHWTHGASWSVAAYMSAAAAVSFVSVCIAFRRKNGGDLDKTWAKNWPRIRSFEAGREGKRTRISET